VDGRADPFRRMLWSPGARFLLRILLSFELRTIPTHDRLTGEALRGPPRGRTTIFSPVWSRGGTFSLFFLRVYLLPWSVEDSFFLCRICVGGCFFLVSTWRIYRLPRLRPSALRSFDVSTQLFPLPFGRPHCSGLR